MPEDIDLDNEDSSGEAGRKKNDSSSGKIDYEAKYRGLSKKYTKLERERDTLQGEYDQAQADLELAKSAVRTASKDALDKLKIAETERDDAKKEATKLAKQVKVAEGEKLAASVFAKNEVLAKMAEEGDLKSLNDFEKVEDYQAYLNRMSEKFSGVKTPADDKDKKEDKQEEDKPEIEEGSEDEEGQGFEWQQQRRNFLAGGTPAVNPGSQGNKRVRTETEINNDLWALDVRDPKYGEKHATLEREMDTAMAQRK
jgi:multidrug efflux pump subunit AcrA (membrane-fusion protein)